MFSERRPLLKRRIILLTLAAGLLLGIPVQAAAGTDNFVRSKTYAQQFSDLPAGSTFYSNVSALYEYGLSVGKPDGTFGLKDSLTVGQAVIFAGRIRSLYRTGDPEAGSARYTAEGQSAAAPYLTYLKEEGVLDSALDNRLTAVATRAEMAHVLANVLPEKVLPRIHEEQIAKFYATRAFIRDVTEQTPYREDILTLYRCGISVGSDASGSFLPDAPITRGAAAAMLTRMIDPALRVTPQWEITADVPDIHSVTLAGLVTPGTYLSSPTTGAEMDECIRWMLASGSNVLPLSYPGITPQQAEQILQMALNAVKEYCEQGYNMATCQVTREGDMTLTFSAGDAGDNILRYRDATLQAAIAAHDKLWSDGTITKYMSDMDKALAYFEWLCQHASYDWSAGNDSLSHTPYNPLVNGLAVCDGYTGAYNLLLKLEGIFCGIKHTPTHIWTTAVLDGEEYHIDVTWGDNNDGEINYDCFAMTLQESIRMHR